MPKGDFNAFLGAGTLYKGQLEFTGTVRIEGRVEGEIKSEGTLILGKSGKVYGRVQVGQLILNGRLEGEVIATKRAVLHSTASFEGILATPVLVMEEGAMLQGRINMTKNKDGRIVIDHETGKPLDSFANIAIEDNSEDAAPKSSE